MDFGSKRLAVSCLFLLLLIGQAFSALAKNSDDQQLAAVSFNTSMLSGSADSQQRIASLASGIKVVADTYFVDVFLNQRWQGRFLVNFKQLEARQDAKPCFTRRIAEELKLPDTVLQSLDQQDEFRCPQLYQRVEGATVQFDLNKLRLDVTIPQAIMARSARGEVAREQWDEGIVAGFLDYRFNARYNELKDNRRAQLYLNVNTGVNIGLWRIRQRGVASWQDSNTQTNSKHKYEHVDAYVQRAIASWQAEVTLGDSQSEGSIFDSYAFRGVKLASDDRMRPLSQRGFAPTVRGVAYSNAKVSIYQKGIEIYQTNVPPGAFIIDDLFPTGYGGDLQVEIEEANGEKRVFTVAYSALDKLVRPGIWRYSANLGQLRNLPDNYRLAIGQGVAQYGWSNFLTLYGGMQTAKAYQAALAGLGLNSSIGAWALDFTHSRFDIPKGQLYQGLSTRLTWSRLFPSTKTQFSFVGYRYSDKNYISLRDAGFMLAMQKRYQGSLQENKLYRYGLLSKKNELSVNMNQPLSHDGGTLYVSASYFNYWNHNKVDTSYQLGYDNSFGVVSLGLNVSRTVSVSGRAYNSGFISLSMPLGNNKAPRLSSSVSFDSLKNHQERATLSSSAGEDRELSWSASIADGNRQRTRTSLFGTYRESRGVANAGVDFTANQTNMHAGISGSVIAHQDGVTLGQPLTETNALIKASGAAGAKVKRMQNVKLDRRGYAVVNSLLPYYENNLAVSEQGLSLGTTLLSTSKPVAPYAGAIVRVELPTRFAIPAIAKLTTRTGGNMPFGLEVKNKEGDVVGLVGQSGMTLLQLQDYQGEVFASWQADGQWQQCRFIYQLPEQQQQLATTVFNLSCDVEIVRPAQQGEKNNENYF